MSAVHGATIGWRREGRRAQVHQGQVHPVDWALALAPVALVFGQLILLGANSGVLSAAAALTDTAALAALVLLSPRARSILPDILPVLLLILAAVVWAFLVRSRSVVPAATPLEAAKLLGTAALLFCGVLAGARRARARLLCGALAAFGGVYALIGFWMYGVDPFRVMGVVKVAHAWRFTGTLLNANVAGVVFGVVGLTALGWLQSVFARARKGQTKPVLISIGLASVLINLTACGFTGSRTAFMTAVVLGAALCVAELVGTRSSDEDERKPRFLALTVAAGLLILAAGLGVGKIMDRQEAASDTVNTRLDALGRFTALAQQRPISGWGLGAFDQVNQSHLQPSSAVEQYDFGAAHSSVIQLLLEGGAPYLVLLAAAGALILARIAVRWRWVADGWSRGLAAAVILAAICSIDDIDLNVPAVAGLAALVLGVLWGRALVAEPRALHEAAR